MIVKVQTVFEKAVQIVVPVATLKDESIDFSDNYNCFIARTVNKRLPEGYRARVSTNHMTIEHCGKDVKVYDFIGSVGENRSIVQHAKHNLPLHITAILQE